MTEDRIVAVLRELVRLKDGKRDEAYKAMKEEAWQEAREALAELDAKTIKLGQHCTSDECSMTHSHTAAWCGHKQTRRCDCPWCYMK